MIFFDSVRAGGKIQNHAKGRGALNLSIQLYSWPFMKWGRILPAVQWCYQNQCNCTVQCVLKELIRVFCCPTVNILSLQDRQAGAF